MSLIDTSTEFGQRVEQRLADEHVVWLTTVRPDGTPQPSPIWFIWEGDTVLVYSEPGKPKVRNIESNPKVALSFNTTPYGENVVVITGEAVIDASGPSANDNDAYVEKYREGMASINLTPETFASSYSVPIRIQIQRVRGF